jgi:hypothetical protein
MLWRRRERSITDFEAPPATPETGPVRVVLERTGPKKIQVIKAIREATRVGLKEAKDLADAADTAPTELGRFTEEAAARLHAELLAAGAEASLGGERGPATAGDDPDAAGTVALLERLAALHERGALTDDEFAEQKRRLLG